MDARVIDGAAAARRRADDALLDALERRLLRGGAVARNGMLFGLFPALQSTRARSRDRRSAPAPASWPAVARAARFRTSLVTVQIALSMALLDLGGTVRQESANVSRVDLGIKIENVVTFGISPELNGYTHARSHAVLRRVEEELAAIPGVTGVSSALVPVLAGNSWGSDVSVQGFKKGPDTDANSRFNEVGPGYYKTMGMQVLSGREFTPTDRRGATKVAIVNEAFAKKFGLGREAVGKYMSGGGSDSLNIADHRSGEGREIQQREAGAAAVVRHSVQAGRPPSGRSAFYVRTAADPMQVLRAIPRVIQRLDPNLPVEGLKTHAAAGEGECVPRPDDQHAVSGVRAPGDAAGGRRPLRRARVLGSAANA